MKRHECAATKVCIKCDVEKSVSEFHTYFDNRKGKTYVKGTCKTCNNLAEKKSYHANSIKKAEKLAKQAEARGTEEYKQKMAEYSKEYNAKNAEKLSAQKKEYRKNPDVIKREKERLAKSYEANKEAIKERRRQFYIENPDRAEVHKAYLKNHYKNNVSAYTEKCDRRRSRIKRVKPVWYDAKPIIELRKQARQLTIETGILHEIDHIVPVQGKLVTGLHCIENMQILPKIENIKKGNKHFG